MITLTRLDKKQLHVNPDLIKTAEAIPDTIVTLTTGERIYVRESVEEVAARFLEYQHTIRQQRAQGILAPVPGDGAAAVSGDNAGPEAETGGPEAETDGPEAETGDPEAETDDVGAQQRAR